MKLTPENQAIVEEFKGWKRLLNEYNLEKERPMPEGDMAEAWLISLLLKQQEEKEKAVEGEKKRLVRIVEEKLETWAALEHSRWSKWQAYLHTKLYEIDDNRVSYNNHLKILPTELYNRWERQINTAYSDLSEAEKESDREQVRPYIEDIKRSLTQNTN